jgi:hypothetical protein
MDKSLHELFTEVEETNSPKEKADILKQHASAGLKAILRAAFDVRIGWSVPSTRPPFELNTAPGWDLADLRLEQEAVKLGRFATLEGEATTQGRDIPKMRREELFIQLLEGLHPTESEIMLSLLKKKLNYKGLTAKLANRAFPNLIPDEHMVIPK